MSICAIRVKNQNLRLSAASADESLCVPFGKAKCENSLDNRPLGRRLVGMKAIAELAKDALELPPAQRLTLARILLDLSEENADFSPDVEAAWENEICRRMQEVKAGRARSADWDEALDRLDRRFPG